MALLALSKGTVIACPIVEAPPRHFYFHAESPNGAILMTSVRDTIRPQISLPIQFLQWIAMLKRLFLYFAILFGSLFFFLLFVLIFLNSTEIACRRQADGSFTCRTKTLLLGRFPMFERETTQIVDVDLFDDGCSDGCAYRAEFITSDGRHVAVNEVYTDYKPVSKRVNDLKSRMNSGESSFEYKIEPLWWVLYLVGGLFLMEAVILTLTIGIGAVQEYMANRDRLPQ